MDANTAAAVWGLGGVIVGSAIPIVYQIVTASLSKKQAATYGAIRVVTTLNELFHQCLSSVYDADNREDFLGSPNKPEYAADIDWKAIDYLLAYEALLLPSHFNRAEERMAFWESNATPPDRPEYIESYQQEYAKLARAAHKLANAFCRRYGLAPIAMSEDQAAMLMKSIPES